MKTTHTPGPWRYEEDEYDDDGFRQGAVWADGDGSAARPMRHVAIVRAGLPETDFNGRLIAAAPELLHACQVVKNFLVSLEAGTRSYDPLRAVRMSVHKSLHEALDAAISKVEAA